MYIFSIQKCKFDTNWFSIFKFLDVFISQSVYFSTNNSAKNIPYFFKDIPAYLTHLCPIFGLVFSQMQNTDLSHFFSKWRLPLRGNIFLEINMLHYWPCIHLVVVCCWLLLTRVVHNTHTHYKYCFFLFLLSPISSPTKTWTRHPRHGSPG